MRAVIQRVTEAELRVDGELISKIGAGFLVLVAVGDGDTDEDMDYLVRKVANMRIFSDNEGKMNLSLADVCGSIMAVSQFTLYASTKKGNRPGFFAAAPAFAREMYDKFCAALEKETQKEVARGVFGADMKISLLNDGPVTIIIDSKNRE